MNIQFFLRFGQLEHLQQLLSKGHIYVNSAKYFKKDLPHSRFDKNEGKLSISHVQNTFFEIRTAGETDWKKLNVKKGVFEKSLNLDFSYIYSLFSILESETRESEFFQFSAEMKKMGGHYILIHNPKEFMCRLLAALEKTTYYYEHGIINYYNSQENHKILGLFHKEDKYRHQKEYRIAITLSPESRPKPHDHIEFDIGSLKDIAEICGIDQYKGLQFQWE